MLHIYLDHWISNVTDHQNHLANVLNLQFLSPSMDLLPLKVYEWEMKVYFCLLYSFQSSAGVAKKQPLWATMNVDCRLAGTKGESKSDPMTVHWKCPLYCLISTQCSTCRIPKSDTGNNVQRFKDIKPSGLIHWWGNKNIGKIRIRI